MFDANPVEFVWKFLARAEYGIGVLRLSDVFVEDVEVIRQPPCSTQAPLTLLFVCAFNIAQPVKPIF